jgi:hypothetical protein
MSEPTSLDREMEHMRRELMGLQKCIEARFQGNAEALRLAKDHIDHRLENLNGMHTMLREIVDHNVTVDHYNSEHKELVRRVEAVEASRHESIGRNAIIVVLISIGLTAILHFFVK